MLYLIGLNNCETDTSYALHAKKFKGRLNFTFYDNESKNVFTKALTAKQSNDLVFPQPDDNFAVTSKDATPFADYIDWSGTYKSYKYDNIPMENIVAISKDRCYMVTEKVFRGRRYFSVMDLIRLGLYIKDGNYIYFRSSAHNYFRYKIEDIESFNLLVTKLRVKTGDIGVNYTRFGDYL